MTKADGGIPPRNDDDHFAKAEREYLAEQRNVCPGVGMAFYFGVANALVAIVAAIGLVAFLVWGC